MRRLFVICLSLVFALVVPALLSPGQGAVSAATATAVDPTSPSMIWGAYARPRTGEDSRRAVENLEAKVGRKLAINRVYLLWDTPFPDTFHTWLADTGRMPMISVKPQRTNGAVVPWRDLADAAPGSALQNEIDGWADRIKAYGVPVYFTFNHEPEAAASKTFGTDADFIDAWRKVVTTFRDRGVTNAKYLWIMTGWAFQLPATDRRQAVKWYPGDAYVDGIGSDEYNDFTCRLDSKAPWKSLAFELEPFRQFGLQHPDEEVWVPEYGSVEDPAVPGRKAQWISDAQAALKSDAFAQFRGLLYFHAQRPNSNCNWYVDSSTSSVQAWAAMGADPFYTRLYGDAAPPPPPPPPPPPVKQALLVVGSPTLGAGDAVVKTRLEGSGYTVTVLDDSVATASDTVGRDVVVVTSTADSNLIKATLKAVAAPVLIWKPALYDDMGLTALNANGTVKSSTVTIADAAHPLAAGRTGTVPFLTSADVMAYGDVGAGATSVATAGGHSVLFSYTTGSALVGGGAAAGCRVGFPAYHLTPAKFTADGKALFDNAVAWLDACG